MATQLEIAEHLDLSDRRVRELAKQGVLPKPKGRGGWSIDACRLAYIAYLRGVASGHQSDDGELDLTAERAKLARAQTETAELKNAVARGELIPSAAVLDHWGRQVVATKAHLRGVPHQFKTEVPHLTPEEIAALRRLIDRALTELADGLPTGPRSDGQDDEGAMAASA